tara:strand:- start:303 stop:1415 length:1113 start_codon:yes stop_codon:yes gene_type:complete
MKIPFVDLSREASTISSELLDATSKVINSGQYVLGPNLDLFEKKFAEYCNVKYALGVGNGSDALVLIMKALGIGPGDEVICPANSFIASAWAIVAVGAKPVFCDVEDDFLISLKNIKQVLTKSTKAVMVVHLTGKLCDLNLISQFCSAKDIFLIEDAAQAIGANDANNKKAGSFGIAGGFSLHPLKNLSVYGDGGVITTNSSYLYEKIKKLRNHGLINRDECLLWGLNTRLDELQAAYALVKMKFIENWTKNYVTIAGIYSQNITNKVIKPKTLPGFRDVFHNYILVVKPEIRNLLMKKLLKLGVDTKIHYPIPLHLQPCSSELGYQEGDLPNAERLAKSMISLPIYPLLKEGEINHIIHSVNTSVEEIL